MGSIDKTVRFLIAVVLISLYFLGIVEGGIGIAALVLAAIFVLTSLVSFCPLYPVFGINTCKTKSA